MAQLDRIRVGVDLSALPTKPRKAITSLIVTTGGAVGAALLDGQLTGAELLTSLGFGLVACFAVWRIPNPVRADQLGLPAAGAVMVATTPDQVAQQDDGS